MIKIIFITSILLVFSLFASHNSGKKDATEMQWQKVFQKLN